MSCEVELEGVGEDLTERCQWPRCRSRAVELIWLGYGLCRTHWDKLIELQDQGKTNKQILRKLQRR